MISLAPSGVKASVKSVPVTLSAFTLIAIIAVLASLLLPALLPRPSGRRSAARRQI